MHTVSEVTYTEKIVSKLVKRCRSATVGKPLVNFFIAGTQKGGTTALHDFLTKHPEICMPYSLKEVHFFDNDRFFINLHSIFPAYRKYHAFFQPSPSTKVVGEACPCYMWNEKAPARIHTYNPDAKIILLLRNPITRAYSHWNMAASRGNEHRDFSEAIFTELDYSRVKTGTSKMKRFISDQNRTFSYLDRSFYSSQIRRLLRFFPRDQILILLSEDLQEKHNETLSQIFSFLEVDDTVKIEPKTIHKREYKIPLKDKQLQRLKILFEPEIKSLELLTERNLDHWLKCPETVSR
ncbi:sulfotransferase [Leptothoe sp. LEGE 181152]|nr:sulfotransferase [Leptothoe sp. LEGE 181152]